MPIGADRRRPALADALDRLGQWRGQVDLELEDGLRQIEAEEDAVLRGLMEFERQLLALATLKAGQGQRREWAEAALRKRSWEAVRKALAVDRAMLVQRAAALSHAWVEQRQKLGEELHRLRLDGLIEEAQRLKERLSQTGLPMLTRTSLEQRLQQVEGRLHPHLRAMEKVPRLDLPPAGVGVVVTPEPAEGPVQALLALLPVPWNVYSNWPTRSEDLASRLAWRIIAAFYRLLHQIGATDAPVRFSPVEDGLSLSIWLGDHQVPLDLRDRAMEAIQSVHEDAEELEAVGLEVYGFWLSPDLVDLEESP